MLETTSSHLPTKVHPRPRSVWEKIPIGVWRLVALLIFLLIWHLASIPAGKLLLPSPLAVVPAFIELLRNGQLLAATGNSLLVFGGGYLLAVVTAIPLGVLMGGFRRLGETLEIYVNGLNSTPRVAFIPFIVLWAGLGFESKVIIVWITAVLPILINTYTGVLHTNPDLIEAGRSFGATRGQIFRKVMLPAALPYIFAGLRIGASLAIIGTVVAELYTALTGLGYLLNQFGNTFQTAKYFVPVLILLALGVGVSQTLKVVERRIAPWQATGVEL